MSADETNILENILDQRGTDFGDMVDESNFEDDYLRRREPMPLKCRW